MNGLRTFFLVGSTLLAVACDSSEEEVSTGGMSTSTTSGGVSGTSSDGMTDSGDVPGGESSSSTGSVDATSSGPDTPSGGSSSTGDAGTTTTADGGQEGDVLIEVTYEGALEGSLTVAVFAACPPAGPPGAFAQEPEPEFPQTVEIASTSFVAGDMPCVIAYLDTGAPSPTSPGEEDPSGEVTFEVAAGEATVVELVLEEPA